MKASELCKLLQDQIQIHGDLEVTHLDIYWFKTHHKVCAIKTHHISRVEIPTGTVFSLEAIGRGKDRIPVIRHLDLD